MHWGRYYFGRDIKKKREERQDKKYEKGYAFFVFFDIMGLLENKVEIQKEK